MAAGGKSRDTQPMRVNAAFGSMRAQDGKRVAAQRFRPGAGGTRHSGTPHGSIFGAFGYDSEQKANMARRPELDVPLTREELGALEKQFGTMSVSAIESFYHAAHRRCQFVNRLPTARSIQELVAVWKYMRRWKTKPGRV